MEREELQIMATYVEAVNRSKTEEDWRDIPNWPYKVSNRGRIYSCVEKKYLSTANNSVRLQQNGQQESFIVSRLVAEAFLPNLDHLSIVEHIDNDKSNNDVRNLRWVAKQDLGRTEVVDKLRDTVAKKYGLIHGISPTGAEYTFRSQREGEQITGVPKSSIGYAIQQGKKTKGWIFYRED